MTRLPPLAGACLLLISGCSKMSDAYDAVLLACGERQAAGEAVFKFAQTNVDAVLIDGTASRPLKVTGHGCVSVPAAAKGLILARTKAGDAATAFAPEATDARATLDAPLNLTAGNQALRAEVQSPVCGDAAAVTSLVGFKVHAETSRRLGYYRVSTTLTGPNGYAQRTAPEATGEARERSLTLPANAPDGSYTLAIDLADAFDEAQGVKPWQAQCAFILDRVAPSVDLSGASLTDTGTYLQAAPGAPLTLAATGESATEIHYCLQEQVEGQPEKACQGPYQVTSGALYAPERGVWSLSYFAKDAAGNISPTLKKSIAVYHADQILRLEAELRHIDAEAQGRRYVEAYPSLFESLYIYESLPLELERRVVRQELLGAMTRLGPRLREWQRYDDRSAPVKSLSYGLGGKVLASLTEAGDLDLLDGDGVRQRHASAVGRVRFVGGGQTLLVAYKTGRLTLLDPETGAEKELKTGITEAATSADGRVIVYRSMQHVEVLKSDGTTIGARELPGADQVIGGVSADGRVIAFRGEHDALLWQPDGNQTLGTKTYAAPCRITAILPTAAGQAFVGLDDTSIGTDYVIVPATGQVGCGTLKWTPAAAGGQDKIELLTYPHPNTNDTRTPNDLDELQLSADGQRLFGKSNISNALVGWTVTALTGSLREVAPMTVGGGVLALTGPSPAGGDLVAIASTQDEVRIYDQRVALGAAAAPKAYLPALGATIQALAFDPARQVVALGDRQGKVRFFQLAGGRFASAATTAGKPQPRLGRRTDGVLQSAFLENATTVVFSGIEIAHPEPVLDVTLLPEGGFVTITQKSLRVFDATGAKTDEAPSTATGRTMQLRGAAATVVGFEAGKSGTVWTVTAGRLAAEGALPGVVGDVAVSADGGAIAVHRKTGAGTLDVYAASGVAPLAQGLPYALKGAQPMELAPFTADGQTLLAVDGAGIAVTKRDGTVLRHIPGAAADPAGLGIAAVLSVPHTDDVLVVAADPDKKDFVRLTPAGVVSASFATYKGALRTVRVLPDGGEVVGLGLLDTSLIVWGLDGHVRFQIGDEGLPVAAFALTADGRDALTFADTARQLTWWPIRDVEEQRLGVCSDLATFVSVRSGDWIDHAKSLCNVLAPVASH